MSRGSRIVAYSWGVALETRSGQIGEILWKQSPQDLLTKLMKGRGEVRNQGTFLLLGSEIHSTNTHCCVPGLF